MVSSSLRKILKPSGIVRSEEHVYTNEKSELYTGCTTISEGWDKSFFLGPWTAKEMALAILSKPFDEILKLTPDEFAQFITNCKGAAKRKSDKAKEDGSAAHAWIENRITSKIVPETELMPSPESPEARNAVTAFAGWAKGKNIQWLASEEIIASHEHRIGGTLDAIAVIDGLTFLVDFKTSSQISASYLLQCAGYDVMLREMGLQVMGYLIIRIPKDGSGAETLTITNQADMEFYRKTFLQQREAHRFYVYVESKLKDMQTGKLKVDAPHNETEQPEKAKVEKVKPQTNERSGKTAGKGKGVREGKGKGRVPPARA